MSREPPPDLLDPAHLPLIDRALERRGWMTRLPGPLATAFKEGGEAQRRLNNRYVMLALTLLFDLFWLPQWRSAPDIVAASGVLRFVLFTPATLLFLILDARGRCGRLYDPLLLALSIAPCLMTAWLCPQTAEMLAQPEIYGTPLILLFTAALLRTSVFIVAINAAVCTLVYSVSLTDCPMLPQDQTATAIFIQVAVGAAAIIFNLQLETRDRRVFLLTTNERIRRALVVQQNSGLLRETHTDPLTGLANRRCFEATLSSRWLEALRTGRPIGLLMIDVDKFKLYNDRYGHVMGDDCLRRVGERLAAAARQSGLVARYGGEEFAAILSHDSLDGASAIAERMRLDVLAMALPHEGIGTSATVTVSIGLASVVPTDPDGSRRLIERADDALYAAKDAGRNRVVCDSRIGSVPRVTIEGAQSP